ATFRSRRQSLLVPLIAVLISDYAVVRLLYHGQYSWFSPYTWLGFTLVGVIGWTLRDRATWKRVGIASISGSVVFFLVTNLGVWLGVNAHPLPMYPHTLGGLVECYAAALPFFRNTILGDLTYAALMFGSYYLVGQRRARAAAQ